MLFNRGNLFLHQHQYQKAVDDYRNSIRSNPERSATYLHMAGALQVGARLLGSRERLSSVSHSFISRDRR